VATTVTCSGSVVVAAEINADVYLSHLSRLLSADPGTVLLRPVSPVVNARTEHVGELGIAALTLLTDDVRRLEVLS